PQDDADKALLAHDGEQVFPLLPAMLLAAPQGPVLALANGSVLAFEHGGKLRWRSSAGPLIDAGIAFRNALLLHVVWEPIPLIGQRDLWPWVIDVPDWSEIANREELQALNAHPVLASKPRIPGSPRLRAVYGRMM